MIQFLSLYLKKAKTSDSEILAFHYVPERIRTAGLPLRSSPQFANRFVTKHKETQAFTGFWRVLFLTIPKGFTAKITSFFGL